MRKLGLILLLLYSVCPATFVASEGPPELFQIRVNDRHGLINKEGRVIIPAEFDQPLQVSDGLIMASRGTKTAFFDTSGKMVIKPQEQIRVPFSEGMAPASMHDSRGKGGMGYLDHSLSFVIPGDFSDARAFSEGMAEVGVPDEWGIVKRGFIDKKGKLVIPARYDKTFPFSGGFARVTTKDVMRIIDRSGHDVTPEGIDFIGIQAEGMIRVWSARKEGYMNTAGKLVIPPQFDQASEFREGMARIYKSGGGGRFGYIDKTGKVVILPRFTSAEAFSDGLALVRENETSLFIDRTGAVVFRTDFDRVYPFSSGLAVFKSGNRYGYIDKAGKIVIPATYNFARPFEGPLGYVLKGKISQYIDRTGRVVWQSE
ncbi:MAG: WG repeat-containing protein [Nitrospirae bacterium]|nr:WG repeat-containing protein [Nitrospirota bacterium]